ncbi:MAG: hypothetical protein ACTSXZ_00790 [Alphaproteobacteria bacterium]
MTKTFIELVIEGPADYVRGYIRGFMHARGPRAEVVFSDEIGLRDDGPVQKIKEALHLSREITHVIVDEETAALVREGINGGKTETGLTIHSDRVIDSAEFTYSFEVFSREHGTLILKALQDPPAGIALDSHEHVLREDPNAKGVELYSPAHDYELKGKGKAMGPLDKIVWLYKELASFDQVDVEPINLIFKNP